MTDKLGYSHTMFLADWFRGSTFPAVRQAYDIAVTKTEEDEEIWWPSFVKGELVFVMLQSQKRTGHAFALESSTKESRLLVQYRNGKVPPQTYNARKMKVIKMVPLTGRDVIICPSTVDFRHLARMVPSEDSLVLEIGCSTGATTRLLVDQIQDPSRIIAVDNSYDQMQRCRADQKLAGVRIERVDVLSAGGIDAITKLVLESEHYRPEENSDVSETTENGSNGTAHETSGEGATSTDAPSGTALEKSTTLGHATEENESAAKRVHGGNLIVFMDIGGNRCHPDVAKVVPRVLEALRPRILVLKSESVTQRGQEITNLVPDVPSMELSEISRFRSGMIRGVATTEEIDKLWEIRNEEEGVAVQSAGLLSKRGNDAEARKRKTLE